MEKSEIVGLFERYFQEEWKHDEAGTPIFPSFEHRFDPDSSGLMYSFVRHYKPKAFLEIGSWRGGSTNVIMNALIKNGGDFTFHCSELMDDLREETRSNVLANTGREPLMLGDIQKHLEDIPELDFLFVDTNHDVEVTKWIAENIWPKLKKGGIFSMHDWPVDERDGELFIKSSGAFPETRYLVDLINAGDFPFKKLYWTYQNPLYPDGRKDWETAFWIKQ